MTTPAHDDAKSPERAAAPEGRDTPALGGGKRRKKVKPLEGEAAIERPYDPGRSEEHTSELQSL